MKPDLPPATRVEEKVIIIEDTAVEAHHPTHPLEWVTDTLRTRGSLGPTVDKHDLNYRTIDGLRYTNYASAHSGWESKPITNSDTVTINHNHIEGLIWVLGLGPRDYFDMLLTLSMS